MVNNHQEWETDLEVNDKYCLDIEKVLQMDYYTFLVNEKVIKKGEIWFLVNEKALKVGEI